jgi:hypothetical protein
MKFFWNLYIILLNMFPRLENLNRSKRYLKKNNLITLEKLK